MDSQKKIQTLNQLKQEVPESIEAERSLLGSILIDQTVWDRISAIIKEEDFYRKEHKLIFKSMTNLANRSQGIDALTVSEHMKNSGTLTEAGGEMYLFEISKNTPTVSNVVAYAEIVKDKALLRDLIYASRKIGENTLTHLNKTSAELLDEAEKIIFNIARKSERGSGPIGIDNVLAKTMDRIDAIFKSENGITGLATGYKDLDNMTSGLQNSDLVVIAGRPSMGKTALAINIAEYALLKNDMPVLIFSMEMPSESLAIRLLSSLGHIDQHRIRTGRITDDDWSRISSAVHLLSDKKLYIDDTPALTPGELRSRTRRIMREHGQLGLVIIDYIQLMQMPELKENRASEISEISRSLKALAKEINVPILALSQLNRSLEQRHDKRPIMSDLRESGAIEQDADLILFIYRDEVYNEESAEKGKAEIIIAKQRNGPIGRVYMTFLGQYTRFENYTEES